MTRLKALGRAAVVPMLAVLTAFLFGAVVIVLTDFENLSRLGTDPLGGHRRRPRRSGRGLRSDARRARSGIPAGILTAIETRQPGDIATAIRPLTETLVAATPLILTGLAVAVSFRAGMFNIGVDGQSMIGALGATLTAFILQGQVPSFAILLASIVAGVLFGCVLGVHPRIPQGPDGCP